MLNVCGKNVSVRGRLIRLAELDADGYDFLEGDPKEFIDALRACGSRIDIFNFMERLPNTTARHGYAMEMDNFAALEISTFDQWWNDQLGFKGRNKAKQAGKKGVEVRETPFDDELVQGIWEVYNESPFRQGKPFGHYGKDLQTVYREEATYLSRSIFVGAYFEQKLIGFIKLLVDETNTQAGCLNIVSMIKHRDKAPTNALFAEAVRACAQRGIKYLVYSRFAYGAKKSSSLSDFKERNGMRQIDVPRYYVPLTLTGKIALRYGFHKKLKDQLPEPVLAKLLEWRSAWYQRQIGADADA